MQDISPPLSSRQTDRNREQLEAHWRRFGVHRASERAEQPAVTSGWARLDALLPGGGYPLGAVTELLCRHAGIGEVSLLLPALAARTQAGSRLAFVSPPRPLNAPALAAAGIDCARAPVVACDGDDERIWCIEQMARSGAFRAFVLWSDTLDGRALRRLQLAAEQARCLLFVLRPLERARERSPAALRLVVSARDDGQRIEVHKCRGPAGARTAGLRAARDTAWQMPVVAGSSPAFAGQPAGNEVLQPAQQHRENRRVARTAPAPLGAR